MHELLRAEKARVSSSSQLSFGGNRASIVEAITSLSGQRVEKVHPRLFSGVFGASLHVFRSPV